MQSTLRARQPRRLTAPGYSQLGASRRVPSMVWSQRRIDSGPQRAYATLRQLLPKQSVLPCQARLQLSNLSPRLRDQPKNSTSQAKKAQIRVACVACQRKKAKASQLLATHVWKMWPGRRVVRQPSAFMRALRKEKRRVQIRCRT